MARGNVARKKPFPVGVSKPKWVQGSLFPGVAQDEGEATEAEQGGGGWLGNGKQSDPL